MSEGNVIESSNKVEFDVYYDIFNREHVTEGILYEAKGDTIVIHLGTDNANVLYAVIDATTQIIKQLGLSSDFLKYMAHAEEETGGMDNGCV